MLAIFLFYNKAEGWQHHLAFSKEFQHCDVAIYNDTHWVLMRLGKNGIEYRVLKTQDAERMILRLRTIKEVSAIIACDIKPIEFFWRPFIPYTCNEITRFMTGIDIGFTFNPRTLYNKLLRYDGRRNYEVIHAWRRQHGLCNTRSGKSNKLPSQ